MFVLSYLMLGVDLGLRQGGSEIASDQSTRGKIPRCFADDAKYTNDRMIGVCADTKLDSMKEIQ